MATKNLIFCFVLVILAGCHQSAEISEIPSSKRTCAKCHFAAKIFSALPPKIRLKIDPLAENMSKGLLPVDVHTDPTEYLSADTCRRCHEESYNSWKKSHHAQAWVDPLFKAAFRKEPMRWCINCHAPLKEQQTAGQNTALANEGINCAVCHIRDGYIYTSTLNTKRKPKLNKTNSSATECILPIRPSASLSDGSLCAGCHQFNFPASPTHANASETMISDDPGKTVHLGNIPMQNTVGEYGGSEAHEKGISCAKCHFYADQKPTHDTAAGTQKSFHVSFMPVKNPETGRPYMEVHLQMKNIAHSWPTGDLFRSVTVESLDKNGKRMDVTSLARIYDMSDKKLISDTTLHEKRDKANNQMIEKTVLLYYDISPEKCRVIYRSQGLIENILLKDFTLEKILEKYRRVLFDGNCTK